MITVPQYYWGRMLDEFAHRTSAVEQVCYFDGIRFGECGVVVTLTFPRARLFPDHFEVPSDAMSQAGKHFRQFGMFRLAQVHTHPGSWIGHSQWDDAKAYSQQDGALSLVLPHHARCRPQLEHTGVHIRTASGWEQLSKESVAATIRVVPSCLDFRVDLEMPNERQNIESPRKRPWCSFFAFWRN